MDQAFARLKTGSCLISQADAKSKSGSCLIDQAATILKSGSCIIDQAALEADTSPSRSSTRLLHTPT